MHVGDVLACYVTGMSRWCGLLRVTSEAFEDATPRFVANDDPYTVRFKVKPEVSLPPELAVPIHEDIVWKALSFTREHAKDSSLWTGSLRTSTWGELLAKDGATLRRVRSGE